MDLNSKWTYVVNASPDQCIDTFECAMRNRSKARGIHWGLRMDEYQASLRAEPLPVAVATYEERAGAAGTLTRFFGGRGQIVEDNARNSQVSFMVKEAPGGRTAVTMWLSKKATSMGMIVEGGAIKGYMNDVVAALTELDPSIELAQV